MFVRISTITCSILKYFEPTWKEKKKEYYYESTYTHEIFVNERIICNKYFKHLIL